jgi:hypothetical protein
LTFQIIGYDIRRSVRPWALAKKAATETPLTGNQPGKVDLATILFT